jgi:hypothetical protein
MIILITILVTSNDNDLHVRLHQVDLSCTLSWHAHGNTEGGELNK